jgi:hypothetical protein
VTAELAVPKPLVAAVNCCCVPMMTAVFGVIDIEGVTGGGSAYAEEPNEPLEAAIHKQIAENAA